MSFSEIVLTGYPVAAAQSSPDETDAAFERAASAQTPPKSLLHRIREVRREQSVSIRRAAQLMMKSADVLRDEEEPATDLTLSQLYRWQQLLEVPVADLLVEPHAPLSAPVMRRAQLVRLMKTAQAILERSGQNSVRRLAQTMIQQLIEIMPELEGVTPWHSIERKKLSSNSRMLESSYLGPQEPRATTSCDDTQLL